MKVIAGEDGTAMNWPHPDDVNGVEHALRYDDPTRSERLEAAAYIAAYRRLVEMPGRLRNQRVQEIRRAAKGEPR